MIRITKILILICFSISLSTIVNATPLNHDDLGGTIKAITEDGTSIYFPALKTDIHADIKGDIASVTVTQTFSNPTGEALNATYLFPLNKNAAVHAMEMEVGDEIIQAKIQKREQAKHIFNQAKKEGKAASLLLQHRPNMFTQNIANLMPNMPIKVTLKYVQSVPKIDGRYEIVVPLIIGPRFQPVGSGVEPDTIDDGVLLDKQGVRSDTNFGQWELETLPTYPSVAGLTIPDTIDMERVSITMTLGGNINAEFVTSPTHQLDVKQTSETLKTITLAKGRIIDNQDFILHYHLAGEDVKTGISTYSDERGNFFSLHIEPPQMPEEEHITPREMVFVLDTSGSMRGKPMQASKTFMKYAVKHLRTGDYFRIIRFGNDASEFSSKPMAATKSNIEKGMDFINSLRASGGTHIPSAIRKAFAAKAKDNTLRIVVFLTDGYIGNESEVLRLINEKLDNARIYAFGVGSSVNRYLLSEMGRMGRGFARYIDPSEEADEVAIELAEKLNSPVLTDINIDWGSLNVSEITPYPIPDLFAGQTIRIQGKYANNDINKHIIKVSGKINNQKATLPASIDIASSDNESATAIPLMWARSKIADLMHELHRSKRFYSEEDINIQDTLKADIVKLGLEFSLSTKWTSFVAVSEKIYNTKPENTNDASVPLPMVKNVAPSAYGNAPHIAMTQSFSGHSTPEPETLFGLMTIGTIACISALRRRKKTGTLSKS